MIDCAIRATSIENVDSLSFRAIKLELNSLWSINTNSYGDILSQSLMKNTALSLGPVLINKFCVLFNFESLT
jgi:hypothetical protein